MPAIEHSSGGARFTGVHRASVYRWKADPDFCAGMRLAFDAWMTKRLLRLAREDAARAERRRQRELELRPMKLKNLEKARAGRGRTR